MKRLALIPLVLAACTTDPRTSTQSDDITLSNVSPLIWDPNKMTTPESFWPGGTGSGGAASVQVLQTSAPELVNGNPAFYSWIIADGQYVFHVYLVERGTVGAQFRSTMRQAFNQAESFMPSRFDSITGSGGTGGPINPPHIGPGGGDPLFSQALVNDALQRANGLRNVTLNWFNDNAVDADK